MAAEPIRFPSLERALPNSAEAEAASLGQVLLDNDLIAQLRDLLDVYDYYVPSHRRIYAAMLVLSQRGAPISPITIGEELKKEAALESVGGISFITNLAYGLPHTTNLVHYATLIKQKSRLRTLIKTAYRIAEEGLAEDDDPEAIIDSAQRCIFDIGRVSSARRVFSMADVVEKASEVIQGFALGKNPGLPTPWYNLNNLCRGGIQETELWGIAALAKQGKSAIMKQWAQVLGKQGHRVLIFTREMSEVKILFRMLAAITGIPASQMRYGMQSGQVDMLMDSLKQIKDSPIFIDPYTSNVKDFQARVREMIRLEGVEIVFADYLQLFHSGKKTDSRATEIGHVWRTMKDTAQDFNTRVVALAQFNREAYKNKERPYFHQVEGSGEGEKAVDVGIVLWTEIGKGEPGARPATLHVDYQRDEEAGTEAYLTFNGRTMEFHTGQGEATAPIDFNDD